MLAASYSISKNYRLYFILLLVAATVLISYKVGVTVAQSTTPAWSEQFPSNSPSQRRGAAMTYDGSRHEVVVFGGDTYPLFQGNVDVNDTWVWDGTNWTQKFPASSPSIRQESLMAFDAARNQVVLFGGIHNGYLNDTWVWDGTNWTQKFPVNTPPARILASYTYDSVRNEVVLFGGTLAGTGQFANDTWVWDGTNWTQKFPVNSPPPMDSATMSFDAFHGQAVLFGGSSLGGVSTNTWLWNGSTWIQASPAEQPSARFGQMMTYDMNRQQVILFGGLLDSTVDVTNDTWVWDGTNWTMVVSTTSPTSRWAGSMTFDGTTGQVLLFGGQASPNNQVFLNDTWLWNGGPSPTPTPSPSPSSCTIASCAAFVVSGSYVNLPVEFEGSITSNACLDSPIYDWDFGDGSPHASQADSFHAYTSPGNYIWTMTVHYPESVACVKTGKILITNKSAPNPADSSTALIEDQNDTEPLKSTQTPVILIHGNHGNEQDGVDSIGNALFNRSYFGNLLAFFNTPEFKQKYKIYRFHYVSDRYSVPMIATSLGSHLDQMILENPDFDKPFIIIAHSMGGLVARYYMNDYVHTVGNYRRLRGGDRVVKLITLGTPHHGSPGANEYSRNQLASNSAWRVVLAVTSFYYWRVSNGEVESTLPYYLPNRSDVLWDNFDRSVSQSNPDINLPLRRLNTTERFAFKLNAYYGFIALDDPLRQFTINSSSVSVSSPGSILFNAIAAKDSGNIRSELTVANVMMGYGMGGRFVLNDGLVPVESASFASKGVTRTLCAGYDHAMLKDGNSSGVPCSNGLSIFASISRDLNMQ